MAIHDQLGFALWLSCIILTAGFAIAGAALISRRQQKKPI